ncbi:DUF3800 domain-containing protein [Paeniglutamicibacter sp. NPDC012692]|uniref:DUF3800 domain-containing protein n=1 Tax=Paeniglutamicibacter sp. NPDC012692 TaxID=3364388 RepID=UPI0036B4A513
MHIFIDDSGDGGFKFESGSSSHLVMAACVFKDPLEIQKLKACVSGCATQNRHRNEFKYSKTKERLKDCFFECTSDIDYSIRAIHIDKKNIWAPKYRSSPSALKNLAISQLLSHGFGHIRDAKVVIDGQDTKAFGIQDHQYIMRVANNGAPGTLSQVTFADSKNNAGIQLADMVAGAINRAVRSGKPSDPKHLDILRPRTYQPHGTLWGFR